MYVVAFLTKCTFRSDSTVLSFMSACVCVCVCVLGCAPTFSINSLISAHPLFRASGNPGYSGNELERE